MHFLLYKTHFDSPSKILGFKIFYLLAFLIFCFSAKGQVSDTTSKRNDTVIKLICKTTVQKQKPLYIVLLHKNQIEITNL